MFGLWIFDRSFGGYVVIADSRTLAKYRGKDGTSRISVNSYERG